MGWAGCWCRGWRGLRPSARAWTITSSGLSRGHGAVAEDEKCLARSSGPRADDRSGLCHGRCPDQVVIAAVQVHVSQTCHAETSALRRDTARLQDTQAGIGRHGALDLSESRRIGDERKLPTDGLRSSRGSGHSTCDILRCAGTQLEQCQEDLLFQCLATRPKRLALALPCARRPGTAIAKQHRRLPSPKPDSACATRDCGSTRSRRVFPGRPVRGVVRTTPETSRLGADADAQSARLPQQLRTGSDSDSIQTTPSATLVTLAIPVFGSTGTTRTADTSGDTATRRPRPWAGGGPSPSPGRWSTDEAGCFCAGTAFARSRGSLHPIRKSRISVV